LRDSLNRGLFVLSEEIRPDSSRHLAAGACEADPVGAAELKILATVALLKIAAGAGVQRFVYARSKSAYGPLPAVATKLAAEIAIGAQTLRGGPEASALRFATIYAPGKADRPRLRLWRARPNAPGIRPAARGGLLLRLTRTGVDARGSTGVSERNSSRFPRGPHCQREVHGERRSADSYQRKKWIGPGANCLRTKSLVEASCRYEWRIPPGVRRIYIVTTWEL
jgi:hypothetical protein